MDTEYSLWNGVLGCPDLLEQFVGVAVVERELPVEHGIEEDP